jgi:hypothetical protein
MVSRIWASSAWRIEAHLRQLGLFAVFERFVFAGEDAGIRVPAKFRASAPRPSSCWMICAMPRGPGFSSGSQSVAPGQRRLDERLEAVNRTEMRK